MKTFKFLTNNLQHEIVGLKGEREYYVTGYISTEEIDRANEVVTKEAMKEMVAQIKSGNVKLDIEHSTFTGENDIPVGKIVDAGIDEKGVWVKCTLNRAHNKFNEYWQSIKGGYLDAFSIAYKVKEYAKTIMKGIEVTLLKNIELLNIAITGNPVNTGAKMTESFYKSLKYINENQLKGEQEMNEEEKTVEKPAPEEKVVEPKQEEVKESEPVSEPEKEEPKTEPEPEKPKEEPKEEPEKESETEQKANPLDQIKSLKADNVELKADNEEIRKELKALKKEINKPVLKSVSETAMSEAEDKRKESETEFKSVLNMLK